MSLTLPDLTETFLYSRSTPGQRKEAIKYLSQRLGHPDEGSQFDQYLGGLKYLFRVPYLGETFTTFGLAYLIQQRYDTLLLRLQDELIGHTAFQTHKDNSLHIFSVEVLLPYQGNGLATYMVEQTLDEARRMGMSKVRIGGGGHETVNTIHHHFLKREEALNIKVREKNWVDLL